MPHWTLPQQSGNSCAAHCTIIAVAEILDTTYCLSKDYAERVLWPQIQFKGGEGPVSEMLRETQNSDPRRIVTDAGVRWSGLGAAIICDETEKTTALTYVPGDLKPGLEALFNMIKDFNSGRGTNSVATVALRDGVYYNASFLMLHGARASGGAYEGMHNILVTSSSGLIYYYNSNEDTPAWSRTSDWKILEGQNGGHYSYVFTGVCVEMKGR